MRFSDQAGHRQTDSQPGLFRGYKRFENLFCPGADLRFADFRPLGQALTTGLSIVALKTAKNWDKAYYDDDTLKDLGLPPDNNQKLEEEQKQEQQQKDATSLR